MSLNISRVPHNPYMQSATNNNSQQLPQTSNNNDDVHHALTRMLHHASPENITRFQNHMKNRKWTLRWAEKFVESVVLRHQTTTNNDDGLVDVLVQSIASWDDIMMYALIATHDDGLVKTLMDYVLNHHHQQDSAKVGVGMVSLSHVWESQDRLQSMQQQQQNQHRVDLAWWCSTMDEERLNELAHVALGVILQESDPVNITAQNAALDAEAASSSFLSSLLKHDVMDWVYDVDAGNQMTPLVHRLLQNTQPLEDHITTCTSTVRLAICSVSLLCMLLHKHDVPQLNFSPSGGVVDHVSKVAFNAATNSSPHGPRWTYEPVATALRSASQSLLRVWRLSQQQEPSERYWRPFVEATWRALLESSSSVVNEQLLCGLLLVLHSSSCRVGARRCLVAILTPGSSGNSQSSSNNELVEGCRVLIATLLNHFQHSNLVVATYSAALLCTLLSDRQEVATNDELSRAIWSAMSSFPLERLVDGIVKLSLSSRACQPLLLHVMDTVELLMCYVEPGGSSFLELGSQRVESLVDTMRKTGVSVDAAADQNTSMLDEEEDTPQLSNVSRPGGSSTPSQAETLSFSGLDRSIRMAAATILGRMTSGPFASLDERSLQLQLHIHSALHGYVSGLGAEIVNHGASYNLNCRSVRLYSLLASLSKEFESQIASVLSNVDGSRRKQLQDRQQDLRKCERDVNEARMQARAYAAEKTKYKNAVRSQAVLLERDRAHIVKQASIRAEQLVKVHFSERAKAEARLEQVAGRANQAESLREEAERQAKASREAEEKAKDELQDALAKLEETQKALDERRDQEEDRKAEMEQARQELEDAREELEDLNARFECAQKELQQSKRELSGTKDAYGQLQDELEVVFSNLSALAQIYEIKESEVVSIVEQKDRAIQEARRQSEEEIQRAGELVENQTRLELENERLKKKLARAKEKLETERQKRHEDEARRKRSGPVSYINQLHKSSSSDRMERSDRKALSSRDNSRSHSSTSRDRSRSSRL